MKTKKDRGDFIKERKVKGFCTCKHCIDVEMSVQDIMNRLEKLPIAN